MTQGVADLCYQQKIAGKASASYVFAPNTSDRAVLLYRTKEFCALRQSGLVNTQVSGNETLKTDGCAMQKETTESSIVNE